MAIHNDTGPSGYGPHAVLGMEGWKGDCGTQHMQRDLVRLPAYRRQQSFRWSSCRWAVLAGLKTSRSCLVFVGCFRFGSICCALRAAFFVAPSPPARKKSWALWKMHWALCQVSWTICKFVGIVQKPVGIVFLCSNLVDIVRIVQHLVGIVSSCS